MNNSEVQNIAKQTSANDEGMHHRALYSPKYRIFTDFMIFL